MYLEPVVRRLSSDHDEAHLAVLRICQARLKGKVSGDLQAWMNRVFKTSIEPHFQAEERYLVPFLERIGEPSVAARIVDEHDEMRRLVAQISEFDTAGQLAVKLQQHTEFEDGQLYGLCEARLDRHTLDTLARVLDRIAATSC